MVGGFADSPLRLNRSLAKLEHWNKDEIEKRAQTLAELALKIWPIPSLSIEQFNNLSKRSQKPPLEVVTVPT